MKLTKVLKEGVKYYWRFLNMDVKDIPYQFNVLFPKVPKYGEEERKEIERKVVSLYGGNDRKFFYTEEDRKEKMGGLSLPYDLIR